MILYASIERAPSSTNAVVTHPNSNIRKRRKAHTTAVLMAQAHQKMSGKIDSDGLARISSNLAERSVSQAQTRAAMAA